MASLGEQYADAKAQSWQLQELCSSIKSSLLLKALSENEGMSQQKAEAIAKASIEYRNHLDGTAAAIQKELSLKAKYEKTRSSFEALRSLSSLEKSTRNQSEY